MGGARTAERPASSADDPREAGRTRGDLVPVLVVAAGLLAFFASVYLVRGYRLPVGPDAPFYVWSTQAAGALGLSGTGFRPGMHALLLDASAVTGLSVTAVTGALAIAVAVTTGLAASALADRAFRHDRLATIAAGLVTGAFTARLASGFLANLLFAALFLAAITVLVARAGEPRAHGATVLAAALLAAGALTHLPFALFGAVVLAGAILLRLGPLRGPGANADAVASSRAIVGAAVASGAAIAGVAIGAHLPPVHTSRDALLRASGLGRLVRDAYLSRWADAATAFLLPVTVPLAAVGAWDRARPREATRSPIAASFASVALSWAAVAVAGALVALATGMVPAGRVLSFALVLPFLAAAGALALGRRASSASRALGAAVTAALLVALALVPFTTWMRAHPFTSREDLDAVAAAAKVVDRLPLETPLVFLIDHEGPHAGVELARYGNVIRMGLQPAKVLDARFLVGGPDDLARGTPRLTGDSEHDSIARLLAREADDALKAGSGAAVFLLKPFNREGWSPEDGVSIGLGARLLRDPLPPFTDVFVDDVRPEYEVPDTGGLPPGSTVAMGALLLGLIVAAGLGWSLAFAGGTFTSQIALSPAIGAGGLVLVSVAADVAGVRLTGVGGVVAVVVAAAGGWLAFAIRRRSPTV